MDDEGTHITDVGDVGVEFQGVDKRPCCIFVTFDVKGKGGAGVGEP